MVKLSCLMLLLLLFIVSVYGKTTFRIVKHGEEDITGDTIQELTELFDEYGKFGASYADSQIIAKIKEMKETDSRFNYLFSIARITDAEEEELYELLIEYLGPLMQEEVEKQGYYMYFE